MTWTTPRTWATNELVTADMMNEQLRDNVRYLLKPNYVQAVSTGVFTTTSTTFVNVNSVFNLPMVTNGGRILCGVSGYITLANQTVDIAIGHDDANEVLVYRMGVLAGRSPTFAGTVIRPAISAGSHNFQLRWRTSTGTATMRGVDESGVAAIGPIIFWAIEI